jgi:hypothetical protein
MTANIDTLTEINLQDVVNAFGWRDRAARRAVVRLLFRGAARRFAQWMADFDDDVGRIGLPEAGRNALRAHYVRDVRVFGHEHIPATGPVLVLSNHPGITDTPCLFASINRTDLSIIALRNPFLGSLPNTTQHLLHIGADASEGMRSIRQTAGHLRQGHAALTFPAGQIEPDPEVHEGAADSLEDWSESTGLFMRLAPETVIVPTLVSGVIWRKTARHWLTNLRHSRKEREQLAAALQLLVLVTFNARPTVAKVRFARAITLAEVGTPGTERIHRLVTERMRNLIEDRDHGDGQSAL